MQKGEFILPPDIITIPIVTAVGATMECSVDMSNSENFRKSDCMLSFNKVGTAGYLNFTSFKNGVIEFVGKFNSVVVINYTTFKMHIFGTLTGITETSIGSTITANTVIRILSSAIDLAFEVNGNLFDGRLIAANMPVLKPVATATLKYLFYSTPLLEPALDILTWDRVNNYVLGSTISPFHRDNYTLKMPVGTPIYLRKELFNTNYSTTGFKVTLKYDTGYTYIQVYGASKQIDYSFYGYINYDDTSAISPINFSYPTNHIFYPAILEDDILIGYTTTEYFTVDMNNTNSPFGLLGLPIHLYYDEKSVLLPNKKYVPLWNYDVSEEIITEPSQPVTDVDNIGGNGDRTSDTISTPVDPIMGNTFTSTTYLLNFWAVYGLKQFFWSTDFLAMVANLIGAPQSAVISAHLYPFELTETTSMLEEVTMLNFGIMSWPLPTLSEKAYKMGWSYKKDLSVGSYKLLPFFGSFLDYSPYTQIEINLPYCGKYNIDPSLITDKTLFVYYVVDIVSGEGKAILKADGIEIASYPCTLSCELSFSSNDRAQKTANLASSMLSGSVLSLSTGNPAPLAASIGTSTVDALTTPITTQSNAAFSSVLERGLTQDIFLTITRPETAVPADYNHRYGRPSLINAPLNTLIGFTSVDAPRVDITGTEAEKNKIEALLKEGIIIK